MQKVAESTGRVFGEQIGVGEGLQAQERANSTGRRTFTQYTEKVPGERVAQRGRSVHCGRGPTGSTYRECLQRGYRECLQRVYRGPTEGLRNFWKKRRILIT